MSPAPPLPAFTRVPPPRSSPAEVGAPGRASSHGSGLWFLQALTLFPHMQLSAPNTFYFLNYKILSIWERSHIQYSWHKLPRVT